VPTSLPAIGMEVGEPAAGMEAFNSRLQQIKKQK